MVTLESSLRRISPVHDLIIGRSSWPEEEEVFGVMVPVEEVEEEVETGRGRHCECRCWRLRKRLVSKGSGVKCEVTGVSTVRGRGKRVSLEERRDSKTIEEGNSLNIKSVSVARGACSI
jgi:hypothetical protein